MKILTGSVCLCLSVMTTLSWGESAATTAMEPSAAKTRLMEGNDRYLAGTISREQTLAEERAVTAGGQSPFAIIVGCADSRVPPEHVFDQGIGDLFVIRNAGNLADDFVLGSIEYAVEHLGTRLVVVLGHERCGAVTAALASDSAPGHVQSIVRDIQPAVAEVADADPEQQLDAAIAANARRVARQISGKITLSDAIEGLVVVPAVYDLDSGKVVWLD